MLEHNISIQWLPLQRDHTTPTGAQHKMLKSLYPFPYSGYKSQGDNEDRVIKQPPSSANTSPISVQWNKAARGLFVGVAPIWERVPLDRVDVEKGPSGTRIPFPLPVKGHGGCFPPRSPARNSDQMSLCLDWRCFGGDCIGVVLDFGFRSIGVRMYMVPMVHVFWPRL